MALSGRLLWREPKSKMTTTTTSSTRNILVIGSLNVDKFLEIDRMPVLGETIATTTPNTPIRPGGKGANQAMAAAQFLSNVATPSVEMIGQVGNDAYESYFQKHLKNVDTSLIQVVPNVSTGQAFILKKDDDNAIIIVGGANMESWEITESIRNRIEASSAVMLQCEIPPEANLRIAQHATMHGIPVFLDVGGQERNLTDILPFVTYVCPNTTELGRMTNNMPVETNDDVTAAATTLLDQGVNNVLVTLGTSGSVLVSTNKSALFQPCVSVKNVVDTTGAGDCYRAVFAASLIALGNPPLEAMKTAAAAAAVCVQHSGALEAMPDSNQVRMMLLQAAPQ